MKEITPKQKYVTPLLSRFSVRNSIVAQVQREDLIRWGQSKPMPFKLVPPIRETKEKRRKVLGFITMILP